MYHVTGDIYEKHGEYKCFLEVWSEVDSQTRVRLFNVWEEHIQPNADASEHDLIVDVIVAALSRIAEKYNAPLF